MYGVPGHEAIFNLERVKGGDIGSLCIHAVEEAASTSPRFILQGRNENTGVALPGPESILLGKTEPQLLH